MGSQYAVKFHTLALEFTWNNEDVVAGFYEQLSGHIKGEFAGHNLPSILDDLIKN